MSTSYGCNNFILTKNMFMISRTEWSSQGERVERSPELVKMLEKNDIICEGSIFSKFFAKSILKDNFSIEFSLSISFF